MTLVFIIYEYHLLFSNTFSISLHLLHSLQPLHTYFGNVLSSLLATFFRILFYILSFPTFLTRHAVSFVVLEFPCLLHFPLFPVFLTRRVAFINSKYHHLYEYCNRQAKPPGVCVHSPTPSPPPRTRLIPPKALFLSRLKYQKFRGSLRCWSLP